MLSVFGVDFSSAPKRSKPITVCRGGLFHDRLEVNEILTFPTLVGFEAWLVKAQGAIGIDAPFGYPREFVEELELGNDWSEVADSLTQISIENLVSMAAEFRGSRPSGSKEPKRATDKAANSASAMKFFNPPVGRMAFRLIPILQRSGHSIFPFDTIQEGTSVYEIYPALAARQVIGRQSYKNSHEPSRRMAREKILIALTDHSLFPFDMTIPKDLWEMALEDIGADVLDSMIALAETAWAVSHHPVAPENVDPREGWIVSRFLEPMSPR